MDYEEIYYKLDRLRDLIPEYRQAEYHQKNPFVLKMRGEVIRCYCDEIKHEFEDTTEA